MYLTLFPKDIAKGRKFPLLILHKVHSFSIVSLFAVLSTKSLITAPSTSVRRFLYFFYADTPSVQTCPPYTLVVSRDFCIRSPELKFLDTLCIRIRMNARIRIFLYTLTSQYQNFSLSPRELSWLILWDVRVRIGYVWKVVYASCGRRYFCIRIKKFADT